jgi:hypothetical protein
MQDSKTIHPGLDFYSDHINVILVNVDDFELRRYIALTDFSVGGSAVNYCLLRGLEQEGIDEIQGLTNFVGRL